MPWAIFACKVINVDVLREALDAYQSLCHKDYHLKIGSVHQELLDISFFFLPEHFLHLAGIGKLADLADIHNAKSKSNLYRRLLMGEIDYNYLQSSVFFLEIDRRLHDLAYLPRLLAALKGGKVIIKFNSQLAGTRIIADFLLYQREQEIIYHLFLKGRQQGKYVPVSFFSRNTPKFLIRQTKLKILDMYVVDKRINMH